MGTKIFTGAICREKLKKRGVPEIFFEISALAQILRVNFRHRQSVLAKMPGKFEKRDVFFAHVIQNANRAVAFAGEADDLSPRTAELAVERLNSRQPANGIAAQKVF